MKKHVLLASMLMVGVGVYAQNGKIRPTNARPVNIEERELKKLSLNEENAPKTNGQRHSAVRPSNLRNKSNSNVPHIATVSATRFSGSMNIFGVLTSNQKPLQYNSDIDIVTFVHRKSQFFTTAPISNTGSIITSWSLNRGITWDSTCIWSDGTNLARYPQGGIYNPPGNTNVNNIYFVGTGPVTSGSSWIGNWYASKSYTASVGGNNTALPAPNTQFIPHPYQNNNQAFVRNYFTYTTDGVVRAVGTIFDDYTNLKGPRGAAIMKGTFNAGSFTWNLDSLIFPAELRSDGSKALYYNPYMAWNNDGTIGYVVMLGMRQGSTGGSRGLQPIVYKTTNSGNTWTIIPPFDFSTLGEVYKRLPLPIKADTNTFIAWFNLGEGIDVTVDNSGRLHLVATVVSAYSNHPDSVFYTYAFNSGGGCGAQRYRFWYGSTTTLPTIMDFVLNNDNTWNGILVDSMATEGTDGGENSCSQWDANSIDILARIQVSRNDAGDKIFYSWTETDTTITGHHFNVYPDLYMKGYDVSTDKVTAKTLVIGTSATTPTVAQSGIFFHYMSTRAINVGGGTYEIPFTFSFDPSFGASLANVDHYYVSGARFTTTDFSVTATPLSGGNAISVPIYKNNTINVSVYPNPTNATTQLVVNLDKASDIHIEIMNTLGQVINKMDIKGNAGQHVINVDLSNENAGVYFYSITTNVGKANGKIVKE